MRLLSVIHNPVYGGAYNELLGQRAGLADAGWETIAVTSDEGGSGAERLRDAGVPVVAIPLHRLRAPRELLANAALAARARRELRSLQRVMHDQRADLVQVHGVINPQAAIAAQRERVAVCWHLYDMVAPQPVRRALTPLVVRYADSATTIGRALVGAHPGVERLGDRLVVTSPPVDLEVFRPGPARRAQARRELELGDDAFAVGTVGNLFPNKGHLDLLEAAGPLLDERPALEVRMLGSASPTHPDHERAVRERAQALGGRVRLIDPGLEVARLLPGLDVFVMPSHSEGLPATLLEAMGCALPVVATDVGAVGELVEQGRTGVLVAPGRPLVLRDALRDLLDDPELRSAMGASGRERVVAQYGLEHVIERRLHAYELALAHRRARS